MNMRRTKRSTRMTDEDRLDIETMGMGSMGNTIPQSASDPIARNSKDIGKPEGSTQLAEVTRSQGFGKASADIAAVLDKIQSTDVSRSNRSPVLGSIATVPSQSWGMNPPTRPAPSATDLLASILRFKWTLMLVFILVSAPIIAAIWTQTVPQYQARAEVRVRPIIPRLVFKTDDNGMIPLYDSFVNTQVSLIRSLTVLQRVLDQQKVQQTRWYRNPPQSLLERLGGNMIPPMERLRDSLSVQPRPRTEIIDVSFMDPSPGDAKLIVDAVLEQYMRYINESSNQTEDALYRQLTEQYRSLETEIQTREKTIADLCKSLGTETPQELVSGKRLRLDEIQTRLGDLRNNVALLEWEMKQAAPRDSNAVQTAVNDSNAVQVESVDTADKQPEYSNDVEWRQLDLNVRNLQHQIALSLYHPNHPDAIRMKKDLEFAEELLHLRETRLNEQWRNRPVFSRVAQRTVAGTRGPVQEERTISVEQQLARASREEQLLQTELAKQQTEFKGFFEIAQSLERENAALRYKRELFDAVRDRLDQKRMERNVPGSIDVLMQAFTPSRPSKDRRTVFTAMALFLGLGMGGGVAFLRANRTQAIYAPKDMPQPMQVPFLGLVPLIPSRKLLPGALGDGAQHDQFLRNESVRLVRTALLSRLDGEVSTTTILITSATPGTGKSSFTSILGKSLAQAGKKVLMIDADFHKRSLSKQFNLLDKPGLMDSLSTKSEESGCVFPTETPGLSIMPTGKPGDNGMAFEEIANGAFKACMNQLSNQFNYNVILLDSSPILSGADAIILAGQVDGAILVEREHVSRRMNVIDALARLASTGGQLLGTVFVGSSTREAYGYGYGYDYAHNGNGKTNNSGKR